MYKRKIGQPHKGWKAAAKRANEVVVQREQLKYWRQGLEIAERWYHEEWDGSEIQLDLAKQIAEGIEREVRLATNQP